MSNSLPYFFIYFEITGDGYQIVLLESVGYIYEEN